ncbi:hypothetical protein AA21952_0889 [Acetobacter oeni LMG 21952]|nr:hypothetical protein AA21952_0889 [Acetobacter oeni LMG 21952]
MIRERALFCVSRGDEQSARDGGVMKAGTQNGAQAVRYQENRAAAVLKRVCQSGLPPRAHRVCPAFLSDTIDAQIFL